MKATTGTVCPVHGRTGAFMLLELLVVIAVIAILMLASKDLSHRNIP
jgi:type II secretory pathway pseudopilin PulG